MLNDAAGFKRIFIAAGYTDLRRGIDGLAGIVQYQFELDPHDKDTIFLFSNFYSATSCHPPAVHFRHQIK